MHGHGGATALSSDHSSKPKKSKTREVSSRLLSTTDTTTTTTEYGNQSPNTKQKPSSRSSSSTDSSSSSRKHKSLENSSFLRGLWPSSSPSNSSSSTTLADHLGNDRQKDKQRLDKSDHQTPMLSSINRQRSLRDVRSFDDDRKTSTKENHVPVFRGGSMRYTGKSSSSNLLMDVDHDHHYNDHFTPARFSIDENRLSRKKPSSKTSDSDTSESEYTSTTLDIYSGGTSFDTPVPNGKHSYMAPTMSSRKHGIQVASRFMQDSSSSRSRRWSADSGINYTVQKPISTPDNNMYISPKTSLISNLKNEVFMKNVKPPSPSRRISNSKGVGSILSMGIELLKGKRSSNTTNVTSSLGPGSVENVHQLKLLHNRLMQWRFINARADVANGNVIKRVQSDLLGAWNGMTKLQRSVLQKRIQLRREKLEMKLNYILQSQMEVLEIWGDMERQHLLAVSSTKDYLHYAVCQIPLLDGAKVEPHSASIAITHASDAATSITSMLTTFSDTIETTVRELVELAKVVTQEKLLLEECLELFRTISTLEIQERSLKSNIMQLKLLQKQAIDSITVMNTS